MHSPQTKLKARSLHKQNVPYSKISERLGVAKSTLSVWFGAPSLTPGGREKQLAHLSRVRLIALATIQKKRQRWITEARKKGGDEAARLPLASRAVCKALLAMLYWAEGGKTHYALNFVNTDPQLLTLYMALLRRSYLIDENRLRLRLHLHHYHSHSEARKFWSETLGVPESQFGKIYVKKRSRQKRFRQNFMGICFVRYYDTKIREELLALGRSIEEALPKQCLLP